jgi:hypothetical protein
VIELSKAIWEGTRAIREIPNYAKDATTSDWATAAVTAALPEIVTALADEAFEKYRNGEVRMARYEADELSAVHEYLYKRAEDLRNG